MNKMKSALAVARHEAGFSLVELLVGVAIIGMILTAMLGVFQVSQQSYVSAASLEDAQSGARAGLDRLTGDLRLIGSYWSGATGAGNAITTAGATTITFLGDVDGDTLDSSGNEITLSANAASGATQVTVNRTTGASGTAAFAVGEYVYLASGAATEVKQITAIAGSTLTLGAALTQAYPAGSIVRAVETITYALNGTSLTRSVNGGAADTIIDNVGSLSFTYYDGSNPPVVTGTLSAIRQIEVALTVTGSNGAVRTMTTRLRPANLSL